MKSIIFAVLSSSGLYGQWMIGHYAPGGGAAGEPVSAIPWSKYSHMIHGAAWPNSDGSLSDWGIRSEAQQIAASKPAGKKLVIQIADNQTGDLNAFGNVTSPGMIAAFVNNIVNYVNANAYDGVELDWEANVNVTQYVDLITRLRNALPGKVINMDGGDWNNLPSVAAAGQSMLDQINVMCYDMDVMGPTSWYNDALYGTPNNNSCSARVGKLTSAGVSPGKIGIGIPFYGRRWKGCTQALVSGCTSIGYFIYRDLITDSTRWQSQYQFYDAVYKSNYLSIPSLNEFNSYNGTQFIKDVVAWAKSYGFGGFLTFGQTDEYLPTQTGDARYPLSTALYNAVFEDASPLLSRSNQVTLVLLIGGALLLVAVILVTWPRVGLGHPPAVKRNSTDPQQP